MQRIPIWDWPTRLIHWLLVALVSFSWGSAKYGYLDLHRYSGYTILGLLVFRIYWGFVGSDTARFAKLVKGPRAIAAYLRGVYGSESTAYSWRAKESTRHPVEERGPSQQGMGPGLRRDDELKGNSSPTASSIGHNPLGALSVVAMLLLLITQVALGLFAVDIDGLESGPLSHLVSFDTGRTCAKVHGLVFNTLLAFISLHVLAVLFYLFVKRDNLIGAMFTGSKAASGPSVVEVRAPFARVVIGVILAAAVVWAIV